MSRHLSRRYFSVADSELFCRTVLSGGRGGDVSQSAQWAPFNPSYAYLNDTASQSVIYDNTYGTTANTYAGGVYQQVRRALLWLCGSGADEDVGYERAVRDGRDDVRLQDEVREVWVRVHAELRWWLGYGLHPLDSGRRTDVEGELLVSKARRSG